MTALEEMYQCYVDAWNQHNPAAVAARFGGDGRCELLPMERSYAPEELELFVRMVMAAFPDLTLRVLRRIPAGRFLIVEWEIGGTHLGEYLGAPPTGEYTIVRGCDVAEFAPDGSIRRSHVYWDNATVARQIGAVGLASPEREVSRANP